MPSKIRSHQLQAIKKNEAKLERTDQALPENWPDDVVYLTNLSYSAAVTTELRSGMSKIINANADLPRIAPDVVNGPLPVNITTIEDEKHPACGQRGLFAARHLVPDSFVCLYLGHVHLNSMSDSDPKSDYDLNLDRHLGLSIDAARSGNHARFTNDYRGIAERPNCEFRDIFIRVPCMKRADGTKWERRVAIFVLSAGKANKRKAGIAEGEELLVSYGKGYWESRQLLAKFRHDFDMLKVAESALEH